MEKQTTKYIVKRSYTTKRTGTEAFVKLIKRNDGRSENKNIEQTKYNIDNESKVCYTGDSFRESCVIPNHPKEE